MTRALRHAVTLACALHALALAGCYETSHCSPELCDGRDNDCDGVVDDGFIDAMGRYSGFENCGACGLDCREVFPSAAQSACVAEGDGMRCAILECPEDSLLTAGACVPNTRTDCLPCSGDEDCGPGALCLPDVRDELHCLTPCVDRTDCDFGFSCQTHASAPNGGAVCTPRTGSCSCSSGLEGAELACLLRSPNGDACVGAQQCEEAGLTECLASLDEVCNAADEDCDGRVDEGFADAQGRYLTDVHCGGCDVPCVPNGPHTLASCVLASAAASCERRCEPGFVDADGLAATGCECELRTSTEIAIGQDGDCDGDTDPTPSLVFVSPSGDDDDDGTSVDSAVRTLQRGLALGESLGRTVLVARGLYSGPLELRPGANLIAGYRPDFRVRDLGLYPVLVENPPSRAGAPVLTCHDIDEPTHVAGLTLLGGDASDASQGSTAVFLDGCTDELTLAELTVLAGRAGSGPAGADSSERLDTLGFDSLADLLGVDGSAGELGTNGNNACGVGPGGDGGSKSCPSGEVSGGDGGDADCPDLSTLCVNGGGTPCGNAGCTDFTDPSGICDLDAAKAVAVPHPAAEPGLGAGGADPGAQAYASVTNRGVCSFCDDNPSLPREGGQGEDGAPGDDGDGGAACSSQEVVELDSGLVRSRGGRDGEDGQDGGGGGGATAGAGRAAIGGTEEGCLDVRGGSGGGGGSGGCGAPGGSGGDGGGASIGVLMRLAGSASRGPSFADVRIVTGSGGDGGDGGIGAAGGDGGAGGIGGDNPVCCARSGGRGGDGGDGGDGGGGGGGCGGGSYGLYVVGAPSEGYRGSLADGVLVERAGVAGRGGNPGFSPGHSGGAGAAGRADAIRIVDP
jgi:hypothetical protein